MPLAITVHLTGTVHLFFDDVPYLLQFSFFPYYLFFFFWISKNLLPKGQSPTNNQEQYKKPKATKKNEKRAAPPLKT